MRHILDCDKLPEYYDDYILQRCWDEIMKEYERLTKSNDYSFHLRKVNNHYAKINELNCLKGCYLLMRLGNERSLEFGKQIGLPYTEITIENINALRSKILALQTRMEIEGVIKKEVKEEKITYEEVIISLENALGRNVRENITLSEYVAIVKAIEKRNKEQKEPHGQR